MKVIKRQRNSGKTTMLLHYMVVEPYSFYVARTERHAEYAFTVAKLRKLQLGKDRFFGMVDPNINVLLSHGYKMLVDDVDNILNQHLEEGLQIVKKASVITITGGE